MVILIFLSSFLTWLFCFFLFKKICDEEKRENPDKPIPPKEKEGVILSGRKTALENVLGNPKREDLKIE